MSFAVGDAATELEPFGGVTALVWSPESNIITSKLNIWSRVLNQIQ